MSIELGEELEVMVSSGSVELARRWDSLGHEMQLKLTRRLRRETGDKTTPGAVLAEWASRIER